MLHYLNLEISEQQKWKLTLNNNNTSVFYFSQKEHKYVSHSSNNLLKNNIVDLLISKAESVKFVHNKHNRIIK